MVDGFDLRAPYPELTHSFPGLPEVDISALHVGSYKLDAELVTDVEPLIPAHQPTLDRQLQQTDPRTLLGRACYDGIEPLPDSRLEQYGGGGFSDLTFDLLRRVLLFRAMLCELK